MKKKKDLAADNEFIQKLKALSAESLEAFRRHATRIKLAAGQNLFRQGDELREVYLIETGFIRMTRAEINGEERPIEFRAPGRILGAAAVFSGRPALMTAAALTRCTVSRLSAESFRSLVRNNPALAEYLLETLSRMFYDQVIYRSQLKSFPARVRLASLLLQFLPAAQPPAATDLRLELPASHHDLAGFLLITPEHFSRLLREMEDEGIIRRQKGWIIVPGLDWLVQEAGGSRQAERPT